MPRPRHLTVRPFLLALGFLLACTTAGSAQDAPGFITGRVLDEQTGRPLALAAVLIVELDQRVATDPTGQYRTPPLAPGTYSLQVELLGYAPVRREGIVVASGSTVSADFALDAQALALEGLTVEVQSADESGSIDALLAAQKAAPAVSDGISAEQIAQTPDSDAGDAIARVPGVSVVDGRFVVVRGLGERYSNTLLNGSELPSPEPTKRIVPMDVFPASLLESVVTTKAATPDRPGDFAGGSVNITTKEFPEEPVLEFKISQGYNSLLTFQEIPVFGLSGADHLAFDGKNRTPEGEAELSIPFAQSLRNTWTPPVQRAFPDLGLGLTWGGQTGEFERAVGYVISFDYGSGTTYQPERYFAFVDEPVTGNAPIRAVNETSARAVDWGLVANVSTRLGVSHTLSFKNLLTREIIETYNSRLGIDPEIQGSQFNEQIETTQLSFVERQLYQGQLSGRHYFEALLGSSFEWRASYARADREEPENRSINRLFNFGRAEFEIDDSVENSYWFRFLDEDTYTGQADWTVPFGLRREGDTQVKLGGLVRFRDRDFDASRYDLNRPLSGELPDGEGVLSLPLETLTSPENIGRNLDWRIVAVGGLSYQATDDVQAGYAMIDVSPVDALRLVGGLRVERWLLNVSTPGLLDESRDVVDFLGSANLTWRLNDDMNLRLAGYQTVSRPDPREVSLTVFAPVTGECTNRGNPQLTRSTILNSDLRWEWFPGPGELLSASAFYKRFDDPFIQVVTIQSLRCSITPENAESAVNFGGEFEVRKTLDFLGDAFERLTAGVNYTFTEGDITPRPENAVGDQLLPLQDQSRHLVNGSLTWASEGGAFQAAALVNHFSDRVRRYGKISQDTETGDFVRTPDVVERGRTTFDAKVSSRLGPFSLSLAARNITNERIEQVQTLFDGSFVPTNLEAIGREIQVSLTYRVR